MGENDKGEKLFEFLKNSKLNSKGEAQSLQIGTEKIEKIFAQTNSFFKAEEISETTTKKVSTIGTTLELDIPLNLLSPNEGSERLGDFLFTKEKSTYKQIENENQVKSENESVTSPPKPVLLHTYQSKDIPNFDENRIGSILKQKVIQQKELTLDNNNSHSNDVNNVNNNNMFSPVNNFINQMINDKNEFFDSNPLSNFSYANNNNNNSNNNNNNKKSPNKRNISAIDATSPPSKRKKTTRKTKKNIEGENDEDNQTVDEKQKKQPAKKRTYTKRNTKKKDS